jgi:hypothetical protein
MSASTAFLLPASDGVILPPSAPAVLFTPDMDSEASSSERLLDNNETSIQVAEWTEPDRTGLN